MTPTDGPDLEIVDISVVDTNMRRDLNATAVAMLPRHSAIDQLATKVSDNPDEYSEFFFPMIDVKVRNTGDSIAFIKAVDVLILESQVVEYCPHESVSGMPPLVRVDVSYVYDVELPSEPSSSPDTVRVNLSQAIPAGDVDRFQLRIGKTFDEWSNRKIWAIYQLRLIVLYNAGSESKVSTEEIVLMTPSPWTFEFYSYEGVIYDLSEYGMCLTRAETAILSMSEKSGHRSPALSELSNRLQSRR